MPEVTLQDFTRAARMALQPDAQPDGAAAEILSDRGAEENRNTRMQFLAALKSSMRLPTDYFDQVACELGLGDQNRELSERALDARVILSIVDESSVRLAEIKSRASETAIEVTEAMIDSAMVRGVSIQIEDILTAIGKLVTAEEMDHARGVAIEIFNEQMAEHLRDVAAAVDRDWQARPESERTREAMRRELEALLKYSRQVLDVSRSVTAGDMSVDDALRRIYRDLGMFVTLAGVMGTLAAVSKAIVVVKTCLRQAEATEAKAELKREAAELEERIQSVKALLAEVLAQKAAASAAAGKRSSAAAADPAVLPESRLEWKRRELEEAVSGFTDRVEAMRREARDAAKA